MRHYNLLPCHTNVESLGEYQEREAEEARRDKHAEINEQLRKLDRVKTVKLCQLEEIGSDVTDKIPPQILEGLRNYAWYGRPTGGFVRAVLCNDLSEAVGRADPNSLAALKEICIFVYCCFPSRIWKSKEAVDKHLDKARKYRERDDDELSMNYPSLNEVESADNYMLCNWRRFLPSPGTAAIGKPYFNDVLAKEAVIMKRICELSRMTPEISKKLGW